MLFAVLAPAEIAYAEPSIERAAIYATIGLISLAFGAWLWKSP
jgi:hypothetical protein